jgi:N-acetylglucosaminyl-diphospho-decaprenol L-rhamnosyltransferase
VTDAALPVYVIHYRAPEWCRATVSSLLSGSQPVRVHVVDNGGLGQFDDVDAVVLRQERNRGFTGAANVALGHWLSTSDHQLCVITSHDLALEPDALGRLSEFAAGHPSAGVLGPNLTGTGRGHLRHYARAFARARADHDPLSRPPLVGGLRSAWVSGSCLVLRRECVEDVGPFDERFGSYCEDVDYCVRANVRGWDVAVVNDARGSTLGSASTGADRRMWSNWVLTGAKHLGLWPALRRLLQGVRRMAIATVRAIVQPSRSSDSSQVVRDSLLALRDGAGLLTRWYGHLVVSRLRRRAPVEAVCSDPTLEAALRDRSRWRGGGPVSALAFRAATRPTQPAHLDASFERGGLES